MESIVASPYIHTDDVPLMDDPFTGNPVDDLIIDRDAGAGREAAVTKKRRGRAAAGDIVVDNPVELCGSHPRF